MLMEETEELFPNEFLLPSLDEAAAVFRREGIKTELAIGSKEPGIELSFPERRMVIFCAADSMQDGRPVFHYCLSLEGGRSWSFPSMHLPTELPAFPYLPRLYECLLFGMEEDEPGADLFRQERLSALQDTLAEAGFSSELSDGDGLFVFLEDEELRITYDFIFPEQSLCILHIICGGDHIFLPEFGNLPDAAEYALILPMVM